MADAAAVAPLPAPALLTLPHSLLYEICHYLWPADVSRLADTCRGLGPDGGAGTNVDETAPCSPLIAHGLRFFRPSHELDADTTLQLICHRLPRLRGLRILDLSGAIMTIHAIEELGRLAAEEGAFQSVRVLSFYGNRLENKGADALGRALERGGFRNTLEGLYVRANQLCDTFILPGNQDTPLAGPLYTGLIEGACRAPLRALSFAQNSLGGATASILRRALGTHLKHLKKLDLHSNRLGNAGAWHIARGLEAGGGMPCLDELYLGFNGIGDEGASCVLGALGSMPAMRELDLASGLIGDGGNDKGILALASALLRNPDDDRDGGSVTLAIETIDLRGNRLTPRAAEALLEALVDPTDQQPRPLRCPRLTAIYWDDNPAVRMPRGREALQALKAATGIAWAYADVW